VDKDLPVTGDNLTLFLIYNFTHTYMCSISRCKLKGKKIISPRKWSEIAQNSETFKRRKYRGALRDAPPRGRPVRRGASFPYRGRRIYMDDGDAAPHSSPPIFHFCPRHSIEPRDRPPRDGPRQKQPPRRRTKSADGGVKWGEFEVGEIGEK
jgi:hypothetical protein